MRFEWDGRTWAIWFRYGAHDGRRWVACYVGVVTGNRDDPPFASGLAACSTEDQYNRIQGRELALERCLKAAVKNHGVTHQFWKAAMTCYKNRGQTQLKPIMIPIPAEPVKEIARGRD